MIIAMTNPAMMSSHDEVGDLIPELLPPQRAQHHCALKEKAATSCALADPAGVHVCTHISKQMHMAAHMSVRASVCRDDARGQRLGRHARRSGHVYRRVQACAQAHLCTCAGMRTGMHRHFL